MIDIVCISCESRMWENSQDLHTCHYCGVSWYMGILCNYRKHGQILWGSVPDGLLLIRGEAEL